MCMIRIACQQMAPVIAQPERNKHTIVEAIRHALNEGANLIVLPELVTSGYVFQSKDEVKSLALVGEASSFQDWIDALGESDSIVVGGYPELADDQTIYNSVAILDRCGLIASYRKIHLWDEEKRWFTPGDVAPPVLETRLGRLGFLICYDLEFPESVRDLALRGAELVVVPTNWPRSVRPEGERPAEMGNAMVAARTSRVFIACCDRVGIERGIEWNGGSCVVDIDGWVLHERPARDAGMIIADIDLARARDKALNERNDVLSDRRPEFYSSLVANEVSVVRDPTSA